MDLHSKLRYISKILSLYKVFYSILLLDVIWHLSFIFIFIIIIVVVFLLLLLTLALDI